jgi:hypothetical protein
MIIYSEILDKTFDSVNECLDAEIAYKKAEAEKKEAEEARQAEIDKAYEEAIAACDKYLELVGIKNDDEDEYSFKIYSDDADDKLFETILNVLFK